MRDYRANGFARQQAGAGGSPVVAERLITPCCMSWSAEGTAHRDSLHEHLIHVARGEAAPGSRGGGIAALIVSRRA